MSYQQVQVQISSTLHLYWKMSGDVLHIYLHVSVGEYRQVHEYMKGRSAFSKDEFLPRHK